VLAVISMPLGHGRHNDWVEGSAGSLPAENAIAVSAAWCWNQPSAIWERPGIVNAREQHGRLGHSCRWCS
jgi:hypothetical protein